MPKPLTFSLKQSSSCHDKPVVRIGRRWCGPGDILWSGETAAQLVRRRMRDMSAQQLEEAKRFLEQTPWP